MRLSDKISAKFDVIQNYLDLALMEIKNLPVEYVNQADAVSVYNDLQKLTEEIENIHYETCMPLEMAEDEREEEIRVLERRLAELKSMG